MLLRTHNFALLEDDIHIASQTTASDSIRQLFHLIFSYSIGRILSFFKPVTRFQSPENPWTHLGTSHRNNKTTETTTFNPLPITSTMPAKAPPLRPSRNAKIPPRRSTMPAPDNHQSHKSASTSNPGIHRHITYPVSSSRLERLSTSQHQHTGTESPPSLSRGSSSSSGSSASHSPTEPHDPLRSHTENGFGGLVNAFQFLNPWRSSDQDAHHVAATKVVEDEDHERRYSGGGVSRNMYAIEEE